MKIFKSMGILSGIHSTRLQIVGALASLCLGVLAVNSATAQQILAPDENCSGNPQAIATFADSVLEGIVRNALDIGEREPLRLQPPCRTDRIERIGARSDKICFRFAGMGRPGSCLP